MSPTPPNLCSHATSPTRRRRWPAGLLGLLGLALSIAVPTPALASDLWSYIVASKQAQNDEDAPDQPEDGSPDSDVILRYALYMAQADKLAIEALNGNSQFRRPPGTRAPTRWSHSTELAKQSVQYYERAAALRPDLGEPHFRAAEVINRHLLAAGSLDIGGMILRERKYAERALTHWRAFAELDPLDPRVTDTLFDQALVYTRLATTDDFHKAIRCYETLLQRTSSSGGLRDFGTYYGNLAETYMMVGRLPDAIATYERALEYGNGPVHGYGLAVALDRDGQTERAREVMLHYAMSDKLGALVRDGVFFVPRGERDYYLGLGYDALGDHVRALDHYERFIRSKAHPQYQPRAVAHVKRLKAIVKTLPKPTPLRVKKSDKLEFGSGWQRLEVVNP